MERPEVTHRHGWDLAGGDDGEIWPVSVRVSGFVRRVGFAPPHPQDLFVLDVTGNNPLRPCGGEGMKLGLGSEFEGGARGIFLEKS